MSADETLPGLSVPEGRAGFTQAAVARAIAAAQLDDRDEGAAALALACARAVDLAHTVRRDPYAVAAAARELRETLARLKLDPAAREGNDAGGVEKWLESLQAE